MGASGPPSLSTAVANGMRTTALPLVLDSTRSPSSAENGARSIEARDSLRAAMSRLSSATTRQPERECDRIGGSFGAVQARKLGPRLQCDHRTVHLHGESNLCEGATFASQRDDSI